MLELPPAPAARVLLGRWFAVFSARSAAAFLRITVAGPPGGLGEAGRAVVEPEGVLTGEVGRGEDYRRLATVKAPFVRCGSHWIARGSRGQLGRVMNMLDRSRLEKHVVRSLAVMRLYSKLHAH